MKISRRFVANTLLALLWLSVTALSARAQAPAAISFDALPRSHRDSSHESQPAATPPRVVTKTVIKHDTVRVVDTVKVTTMATPATTPAVTPQTTKPAPQAAVPFAPPTVAGLLQVMLFGGDNTMNSYRIRRAEIKVTTDLGHKSTGVIMVDVAKALSLSSSATATSVTQSSRVLQDAYVSSSFGRVQIDAGQQRLPLGYEGSNSSSQLETVDRALMASDKARGASFGDVRDIGVAARGSWKSLDFRAGAFNGSGETMNDVDKNDAKAVVGQLAWRVPFVPGLRVGASGATSGSAAGDKPSRDRVGGDIRFARGPLTIQSEAMTGRDGALTRRGMYALGAYAVVSQLKLVTRFDAWDPDTENESVAADVTERDYLGGLTWLPPASRLKLQLSVVRKTYSGGILPSATLGLTQLQASW